MERSQKTPRGVGKAGASRRKAYNPPKCTIYKEEDILAEIGPAMAGYGDSPPGTSPLES